MKSRNRFTHHAFIGVLLASGLVTLPTKAQAPTDVRVALIVGNAAYPGNMALANPSNDAKDMAVTLRNMGFSVIELVDANRAQMLQAIEQVNQQLGGKQGVGMLFYAGHGLQLDWRNYMVPVDAKLQSAKDVPANTVDIEAVMNAFKSAKTRMNIVVLDACRDNPFADGKTASGKGLAPLDAPTGTFLAYATAPGNVAADGAAGSKNGLYTGYLLQELQKPNARIEDVFKRVRFSVRKASDGAQIPWETTSLEDDFVFNTGITKVVKLSSREKDKQFDVEKAQWDKIKDSKTVDPFYAFVQQYPNGLLSQAAMSVIERMNAAKTLAYADKNGAVVQKLQGMFQVGNYVERVRRDGYTKLEIGGTKGSIVKQENGNAYFSNGGIATLLGETVRAPEPSGETYDPPRMYIPADGIFVGKKWETKSVITRRNGEKGWVEDYGKVLALEDVTVPAGTFKTYKLERNSNDSWGTRTTFIAWVEPKTGIIIRMELEIRRQTGNADRWVEEATVVKSASL